jgi:hypothetical protein
MIVDYQNTAITVSPSVIFEDYLPRKVYRLHIAYFIEDDLHIILGINLPGSYGRGASYNDAIDDYKDSTVGLITNYLADNVGIITWTNKFSKSDYPKNSTFQWINVRI